MNKVNKLIFFLISLVLMNSCTKDNLINQQSSSNKHLMRTGNGILTFNSQDDFASDLVIMNSMNEAELLNYQQEHNYLSYGLFCDSLYSQVAKDSLNNELVVSGTNSNSDYLELLQDPEIEGDLILSAKFEHHPLYYIMNMDRMYVVDTMVYKVFNEGTLAANISYIEDLRGVESFDGGSSYASKINIGGGGGPDFGDSGSGGSGGSGTAHNAGKYRHTTQTNGKNRTYTSIDIHMLTSAPAPQFTSYGYVRPYKRTWGVWFWAKRTITYSFHVAIDIHKTNGTYDRLHDNANGSGLAYKKDHNFVFFTPNLMDVSDYHYAGYDCFGDTPDTPPASFSRYTYNL